MSTPCEPIEVEAGIPELLVDQRARPRHQSRGARFRIGRVAPQCGDGERAQQRAVRRSGGVDGLPDELGERRRGWQRARERSEVRRDGREPDVLALQTMLFVKGPGSPGQGYHQDSFHIITQPDTLIGAWVALDRADEENGCVWITSGSQHEPVYPDADESRGHGGDAILADIPSITGADDPDEARNGLSPVVAR